MALSPLSRHASMLSLTAAVLIVLSQVMRLGLSWLLGSDWATTPQYTLTYSIALLGMGALLLAVTAIYTRGPAALGRLGLIGYLAAFLGTLMVAGDWWFEAFAVPRIATAAPRGSRPPDIRVGARRRHRHAWAVHGGLDAVRPRRPTGPRLPPRRGSTAARRRAGRPARPVDAVPDPVGDRDRLDRPHLGVGTSQPAHRSDPTTTRASACSSTCSRPDIVQRRTGAAMKPLRLLSIRLLMAVACAIASVVLGSTSAAADDGPDLAAVDRFVRSEIDAQRIPGLALRIVHVQGFGQADRAGRQVTPETPFLIGSVTKSFTALAIMQLSETGQVQLDAPVQRYLPWWRVADPDASTQITVRHLLNQVSGLSKATGNAYATSGDTHDSALEDRVRALRDVELTEPVGTTWQYSNANYWTLGMIVQAVSGQSYETYIQQHIFDPLQMRNSYTSRTEAVQHGLPTGHRYWYGFPVASELPFDRGGLGSGGLSSSARDMTHYLGLYLNDGRVGATALVSPAGAAELQRAGVPTGLDGVSYAMGWDVGAA